MITIAKGLEHSFKILNLLKKDDEILKLAKGAKK